MDAELAVIGWPAKLIIFGLADIAGGKGIVEEPMITSEADGASEMGVPAMVTAGPPGNSVREPRTKAAFELAVITDPPTVIIASGFSGSVAIGVRLIVEDPRINAVAAGAKDTIVPEMVAAGPPGMIVWEPMTRFDCALRVTSDTMGFGAGVIPFGVNVVVPTINAEFDGAREITVPEIVTGGPPGERLGTFTSLESGLDVDGRTLKGAGISDLDGTITGSPGGDDCGKLAAEGAFDSRDDTGLFAVGVS